jgi:hypothetical protein
MNINQQLGLPCGIGPFYKQPSLFYRGVDSNINMLAKTRNMQWENSCGSCGGYSNIIGQNQATELFRKMNVLSWLVYPTCSGDLKDMCKKCVLEAKSKPKPGWVFDGKKNYIACMNREISKLPVETATAPTEPSTPETPSPDSSGNGGGGRRPCAPGRQGENKTMLYVGIGIGALALIGGALFLLRKK